MSASSRSDDPEFAGLGIDIRDREHSAGGTRQTPQSQSTLIYDVFDRGQISTNAIADMLPAVVTAMRSVG